MRASGSGLLLPRLIPIGDPDIDERIGGALEAVDSGAVPAAIDPTERVFGSRGSSGRKDRQRHFGLLPILPGRSTLC